MSTMKSHIAQTLHAHTCITGLLFKLQKTKSYFPFIWKAACAKYIQRSVSLCT